MGTWNSLFLWFFFFPFFKRKMKYSWFTSAVQRSTAVCWYTLYVCDSPMHCYMYVYVHVYIHFKLYVHAYIHFQIPYRLFPEVSHVNAAQPFTLVPLIGHCGCYFQLLAVFVHLPLRPLVGLEVSHCKYVEYGQKKATWCSSCLSMAPI